MKIELCRENLNFELYDTILVTADGCGNLSCGDSWVKEKYSCVRGDDLFEENAGELYGLRTEKTAPKNVIFLCIGQTDDLTLEKAEEYFAKAAKEAVRMKGEKMLVLFPETFREELVQKACEAMQLAQYTFKKYQTKEPEHKKWLQLTVSYPREIGALLDEAEKLAAATMFARDLGNEPANVITPTALGQAAVAAGKKFGFEVELYGPREIKELGMYAYYSVGMGSDEPMQLIVMKYLNNPQSSEITGFVGKGMTYDSGGYALKSASGMATMKIDMAGSAGVIGAMCAIADNHIKANVVAVVAACENMVSGHAYRNGDIIPTMSGKYVEVGNTDAEGRLTMIDAITYAIRKLGATSIIDIATLTGSAVSNFGREMAPVLYSDDTLWENVKHAAQLANDKVWPMPCDENLGKGNDSKIADIKNIGGSFGGTIAAGMFIREFTEGLPWAHLDMAGPSAVDEDRPICVKGSTGWGTRLLYHLIKEINR